MKDELNKKYAESKQFQYSLLLKKIQINDELFNAGIVHDINLSCGSAIYIRAKTLNEVYDLIEKIKSIFTGAHFNISQYKNNDNTYDYLWNCYDPDIVVTLTGSEPIQIGIPG